MACVPQTPFTKWLNDHYLDWQKQHGRASEKAFALWLGFKPTTFNHYTNGEREPSRDDCDVLAYRLNDVSCYKLLGYPTPNALLLRLKMEFDLLPEETQADIGKILEKAERKRVAQGTEASSVSKNK